MYDIFKKHILRKERYLLPVLNKSKKIYVDDEYINIDDDVDTEDFEKKSFQLPHDVTCLEFKKHILLLVDQFKNQIGFDKNRKLIIFTKIRTYNHDPDLKYRFVKTKEHEKQTITIDGANIISHLLGLQKYEDDKFDILDIEGYLNKEQKELLTFCASNTTYLKWGLETNIKDGLGELDNVFYLVSKKNSLKVAVPKYKNDEQYISEYLYPLAWYLLRDMYRSVIYLKRRE